ncbi:MAG: Ig-like domain-containing protein, partial [Myxococcota bacterium]|nr:Ig-like domain-containing protein [Myxococcota bacterium]
MPPSKRIRLFPTLQTIPADPTYPVPVRVKVATPQGAPDTAAQVNFTATGGTISAPIHEGNGVYKAMFTPAMSATPVQATVSVAVADSRIPQNDALTINLAPARPASLALSPEPATLPAGAMAFQVLAKLTNASGGGVSGQTVDIQAEGARLNGPVRDLGGGDYQAAFSPRDGNQAIPIHGAVKLSASGNPLHRIVAIADSERISAAGGATTGITVVALDAHGYPVAGVPVNLGVLQGGGAIPPMATTDANGMARVQYTAADGSGLATIQASSGDKAAGVAILKAPGSVAPGLDLPAAGSAQQRQMTDAWDALITSAQVTRPGAGLAVRPTPLPPSVATQLE